MSRRGFTLVEVVMGLIVLQVGVLGVLGTLLVASETLRRAERLERAAAQAEAVLDSLRGGASPDSAGVVLADVRLAWSVDGEGRVDLVVRDAVGGPLLRVQSRVPVR